MIEQPILIATPMYDNVYSGVGTYARLLVAGLRNTGVNVTVVSPDCAHCPPDSYRFDRTSYDPTPNRWFSNSRAYDRVLDSIGTKDGVVHFLDGREAILVRKRPTVRFVGTVHDTYSFDLQSKALLREYFVDWKRRLVYYYLLHALEKRAYRKLDMIISNTDFVRDRLIDFYDVPEERVRTVLIGAPIAVMRKVDRIDEPFTVSFIGGNFQRKGLLPLAAAVRLLRDRGVNARLIVAGRDRNTKQILGLLRRMSLDRYVEFCGHIDPAHIPDFLRRSHVFAMPSLVEAYGLVFLEAMACGIPVLGSIHGGTKELVCHEENGLLADPFSSDDICEKLCMLRNAERRQRIIENGYATVERLAMAKSVDNTLIIYRSI